MSDDSPMVKTIPIDDEGVEALTVEDLKKIDKLHAIGAIGTLEWCDLHRKALGMKRPRDYVEVTGISQ